MPHFRCEGCRIRLSRPLSPAGGTVELCPDCGALLEPVSDLTELVGFQAIGPRGNDAFDSVAVQALPMPRPSTT